MHTTYSMSCGATYIKFNDKRIAYTEEMSNTINIDYDKNDEMVGIEILGEGLTPEMFKSITFEYLDLKRKSKAED
jgi:uncharacterized protein YuzE